MSPSYADQREVLVRDVMTTEVHTVDMDDPIQKAKALFDREHFHHAIVLMHEQVYGVVSDRDILKEVSPFVGNLSMERAQDLNTLKKRVHQIMSRNLVTVGPDETVVSAAEKMLTEQVSCVPVVDERLSLLGIVTTRDVLRWAVSTPGVLGESVDEVEPDRGIVVVVDGRHCYYPPVTIGRLIRLAERSHEAQHGAGSAMPQCLPNPRAETVPV